MFPSTGILLVEHSSAGFSRSFSDCHMFYCSKNKFNKTATHVHVQIVCVSVSAHTLRVQVEHFTLVFTLIPVSVHLLLSSSLLA